MSYDEELKKRLQHDENKWMKIAQQSNLQHANTLNQLADLFGFVRRLETRIVRLEKLAKEKNKL